MSKFSTEDLKTIQALDLISGGNGTIKLVAGDSWTGVARGLSISVAGVITTMSDSASNTKASYFSSGTYDVVAGEIFTPINVRDGARFTSLEIATGSAMIIL